MFLKFITGINQSIYWLSNHKNAIIIGIISGLTAKLITIAIKTVKDSVKQLKDKDIPEFQFSTIYGFSNLNGLFYYFLTASIYIAITYYLGFEHLLAKIINIQLNPFILSIPIALLSFLIYAQVLNRIASHADFNISAFDVSRLYMAMHFLEGVAPSRKFGVEPIMAYLLSETSNRNYEDSLACTITSDSINLIPFIIFMPLSLIHSFIFSLEIFQINIYGIVIILVILGISVILLLWPKNQSSDSSTDPDSSGLKNYLHKLKQQFEESKRRTNEAFKKVQADKFFSIKTSVVSFIAVAFQLITLYLIQLSVGINPGIIPTVSVYFISSLAVVTPTMGGRGIYEGVFSALIAIFYSTEMVTAFATGILFSLTTFWLGLILGLLSMLTLNSNNQDKPRFRDSQ